jgi:dGTPase
MDVDWEKILSSVRFNSGDGDRKRVFHEHYGSNDFRVPHEKDFDRLIFSAPIRRLKDKTQIFPLDQHDSIRTRLTHSLEVANIAKTLAAQLASKLDESKIPENAARKITALTSAISISHDMGNPPFGHQGEGAIRAWVNTNLEAIQADWDRDKDKEDHHLYQNYLKDFLYFDGNPQAFRLVATLQGVDKGALNLSASTLRAMFKYPWSADSNLVDSKKPKFGYFQSEREIFEWCCKETGIESPFLHPLTPIMEACDDIAYSILDIEDGIKKELVSPAHLMVFLKAKSKDTAAQAWIEVLEEQYEGDLQWLASEGVVGRHADDILTEIIRSYLIALAVSMVVPELTTALDQGGQLRSNVCLAEPKCHALLKILKSYSKLYIYTHKSVERIELKGHKIIPYLLGCYWLSIEAVEKKRATKVQEYVYKSLPASYVRAYQLGNMPGWYKRLQLACDMVCGMTDSFAMSVADEFEELNVPNLSI